MERKQGIAAVSKSEKEKSERGCAVNLFRELTPQEAADFRLWARQNYVKFSEINGLWHPVVQDECVAMNAENGFSGVPGIHGKKGD